MWELKWTLSTELIDCLCLEVFESLRLSLSLCKGTLDISMTIMKPIVAAGLRPRLVIYVAINVSNKKGIECGGGYLVTFY